MGWVKTVAIAIVVGILLLQLLRLRRHHLWLAMGEMQGIIKVRDIVGRGQGIDIEIATGVDMTGVVVDEDGLVVGREVEVRVRVGVEVEVEVALVLVLGIVVILVIVVVVHINALIIGKETRTNLVDEQVAWGVIVRTVIMIVGIK